MAELTKKLPILIAEDEPIILNNLAKKVEKASSLVFVAGKVESGRLALQFLEEHEADILITDIEMPGMNGLELIRTVKERYPHIHVVILSGYSNFEYARTALRYGVEDYLLKPVSLDTLRELLEKLSRLILTEHGQKKREILSKALNGAFPEGLAPSLFPDGQFSLIHLTLGNFAGLQDCPEFSQETLALWERISLEDCFCSLRSLNHVWMIDEAYPLQKFLILHLKTPGYTADYLALTVENYLKRVLAGFPFFALVLPAPISYSEIWASAKKLRKTVLSFGLPFCQRALTQEAAEKPFSCTLPLEEQKLLRGMNQPSSFLGLSGKILEALLSLPLPSQELLLRITDLFSCAGEVFQLPEAQYRAALSGLFSRFYLFADKKAFHQETLRALEAFLLTAQPLSRREDLAGLLKKYIHSRYTGRLSLNDLAQHFGYTPSYLNRIFKKEYGLPPLQYITTLKIERAKELLLENPGVDIKEVALAVGYEDARYFSRVFKNETGMSPSSFLEKK